MHFSLKFEIYFFIFFLLLIIVRSIFREHDRRNRAFLRCCYVLMFLCILRQIHSCFSFSYYYEIFYFMQSLDFSVWICLSYCWVYMVLEKVGFENIIRKKSAVLMLFTPVIIITVLSFMSRFNYALFKFNLFGEPSPSRFSFVLYYFVVLYASVGFLACLYNFMRYSRTLQAKEILFLGIFTLFIGVSQYYSAYSNNNLYACVYLLSLVMYYIALHEDKVFIDPLTGLNNRNRFRRYLSYIMSSQSLRVNMYLTYIDIDNFKSINDNHGHLTGDLALRTVAEAMREISVNSKNFLARIGGDEFVIVSSHPTQTDLKAMIVRMKKCLNEKAKSNFSDFTVGFSVGTTQLNIPYSSISDVIKSADRNMYRQKQMKKQGLISDSGAVRK